MIRSARVVAVIGIAMLSATAHAQRFKDVVIKAEPVAEGIHMLTGAGGNMALVTGDEKTFLVDDQYPELSERIREKIASLSDRPVDFLVNTHWHGDHSGGNKNFAETGTVIFAHDNVRKRMSVDSVSGISGAAQAASPAKALPIITFTEELTFHINGKTLQIMHLNEAHTDGDAVVYFKEDNVLHTGDIYFNGLYPFIDTGSGGSIRGTIAAVEAMLSQIDAQTKIIPGHGPLSHRDELRAYRDFLTTVADAIAAMISDGKSMDEVVAAKPTADFDSTLNRHGFFKPDQWVSMIYKDLSR